MATSVALNDLIEIFGENTSLEDIRQLSEKWSNLYRAQRDKILLNTGETGIYAHRENLISANLDELHVRSDSRMGHTISTSAVAEIVSILRENDLAKFS